VEKSDFDRPGLATQYDNLVNYGTNYKIKNKKADTASSTRWNLYQGNIFMPILDELTSIVAYNNELQPESKYVDINNQYNAQRERNRLITSPD